MAASKSSDINNNPILGQQCFKVEPNIQLNPTSQKWDCYTFRHTAAYGIGTNLKNDSFPVYWDGVNRVSVVELRSPVTIVLNCELILQSVELAFKTPQMIFNGYENGSIIHFNDLAYDYPVPEAILSVLYGMWKIDRDRGEPAGVNFYQFLQNNSNNTWSYHKHRSLNEYEVVVPRFDLKTLGMLEYSEDKPQGIMKDRLAVGFTIPFQYTIQFGMPTLNILNYSVVYNNQLLPFEYIPVDKNQRFNNMDESRHGIPEEGYAQAFNDPKDIFGGIARFPYYDDWMVPDTSAVWQKEYQPIMILALLVNEDGTPTVEDLSVDLSDEIKLTPLTKEILYQQGEASCNGKGELYNVSVYKNDKLLVPGSDWTFDHDLKLTLYSQDLHADYHIVISALTDMNNFDYHWIGLIFQWFPAFPKYIRQWVRKNIENGFWGGRKSYRYDYNSGRDNEYRVPQWPKKVYLGEDGNIYDVYGKIIDKLTNLDLQESKYASDPIARVIRYNIVPRKATLS